MPTRILREGIISSEAVNSVSDGAEILYRRLMSVADDYGRYFCHPSLVRAACFPLQLDRVSEADVKHRLSECVRAGLLVIYGDGKYLTIKNFKQQERGKSKFPEPTQRETLSKCESNAKQMQSKCVPYSESESESESYTKSGPDKRESERRQEVARIIRQKVNPIYKRPEADPWTHAEESALFEVCQRPAASAECEHILLWRQGLHPDNRRQYFPQSVNALLSRWTEHLDKARVQAPIKKPPAPPAPKKEVAPITVETLKASLEWYEGQKNTEMAKQTRERIAKMETTTPN